MNSEALSPLGAIILDAMRSTKTTQEMLAEHLEVSQPVISKWLHGAQDIPQQRRSQIYWYFSERGIARPDILTIPQSAPSKLIKPVMGLSREQVELVRHLAHTPVSSARIRDIRRILKGTP